MRKVFILALSIGMVFAAGCQLFSDDPSPTSSAPVNDEPAEQIVDLDSPTGGYTATDEQPAFGEPENFVFADNEIEYEDGYQNSEEYREKVQTRGTRKFRLRTLWGRLERSYQDSTISDCCPVDFSGQLTFKAGVAIVERTIGFEILDYVYREGRSTIKWVSHTCP
ncbi:MAG: hypothetical protein GF417_05115, partial [Candidatus Latescibacteria bacterium]|nr:hypothetical protein [bacterium]MBD3423799.1 hypothetical protein [Candidatus Latescibacterota bacterium]